MHLNDLFLCFGCVCMLSVTINYLDFLAGIHTVAYNKRKLKFVSKNTLKKILSNYKKVRNVLALYPTFFFCQLSWGPKVRSLKAIKFRRNKTQNMTSRLWWRTLNALYSLSLWSVQKPSMAVQSNSRTSALVLGIWRQDRFSPSKSTRRFLCWEGSDTFEEKPTLPFFQMIMTHSCPLRKRTAAFYTITWCSVLPPQTVMK